MKGIVFAVLLLVGLFSMGDVAFADGLVPCTGAPGDECQACKVVDLINNVVAWLIGVLSIVIVLVIVYAGLKLVTSGGSPEAKQSAKSVMSNAIIGYIIVLGAWLFIDYGMKALFSAGDPVFGVWNNIECVIQPNSVKVSNPIVALSETTGWSNVEGTMQKSCTATGIDSNGVPTGYDCTAAAAECAGITGSSQASADGASVNCKPSTGGSLDASGLGQCNESNGACSVAALTAAGLTPQQANVMSCIAMTESSGIASTPPYNIKHPASNSSACGTFQIVRTTWNAHASKIDSSCRDHATSCQNARCNAAVMGELVKSNGFRDWTCEGCNNKASKCITKFGG